MHPVTTLGNLHIYSYTVAGLVGIIAGVLLMVFGDKRLKRYREDLFYCALYALIGGFLGAKLLYIITLLPRIWADPRVLLMAAKQGAVFYGGVIGGLLGMARYAHRFRMPFWRFTDAAALGIPAGHFFGRIGCFLAGCCYGRPTEGFLGVTYPACSMAAPSGIPLHPVPLYEAGFNILLVIVLLILAPRIEKPGRISGYYLLAYGAARPIFDVFRADHDRLFFIVSFAISAVACLVGILLLTGFLQKRLFPPHKPASE